MPKLLMGVRDSNKLSNKGIKKLFNFNNIISCWCLILGHSFNVCRWYHGPKLEEDIKIQPSIMARALVVVLWAAAAFIKINLLKNR